MTVLKDAATKLGKVDLHGPLSQSAGMSASNAALLARAAAHRTVEATREQWPVALQVGGGEIGVNDQYRPLIWLDLTAEQLEAWNDGQYPNRGAYASTEWHRPDSWDAVHDGLTLDLVDSVDQLEARVAAVNEQRQRAEAERRAENFRRGGLGV